MMSPFFDLFQLVMLALFFITFIGRAIYLRLSKGINAITIGSKSGMLQQLVELAFPVWLILGTIEVLRAALPIEFRLLPAFFDTQLFESLPAQVVGVVLMVVGYGLFVGALISFGDSWRVGVDEKKPGSLVTGGVFSLSRNPIFVFLNLYAIGSFLINGTLIFLIFAILLAASLHYQILQEEKFLLNTYGSAYRAYFEQTSRYLSLKPLMRRQDRLSTH